MCIDTGLCPAGSRLVSAAQRGLFSESPARESWDAVNEGSHNSNTDMIHWNGAFHLVCASSDFHFAGEESRLFVLCSEDARNWEEIAQFDATGEGIHDPKQLPG